uniref:DUF7226 domain-containing protein n=1 Tax=Levilactobacillus namurensis TaxID=380393 RepID=UPI000467C7DB
YMNSITFKRQYKFRLSDDPANIYQIEDTSKQQLNDVQTIESVQQLIEETPVNDRYPQYSNGQYVSFPQANNLQIALDYLAILSGQDKYITDNDEEIATTSAEAFVDAFKYDQRQYGYYFNWLGYFGLVDRDKESGKAIVTERGRQFNNAQFSERNWMLVKLMATHLSSRVILESLLRKTSISNVQVEQAVKQEMKNLPENKKIRRATVPRRISGIKSMCKQVLAQMEIFD